MSTMALVLTTAGWTLAVLTGAALVAGFSLLMSMGTGVRMSVWGATVLSWGGVIAASHYKTNEMIVIGTALSTVVTVICVGWTVFNWWEWWHEDKGDKS